MKQEPTNKELAATLLKYAVPFFAIVGIVIMLSTTAVESFFKFLMNLL